MSIISKVKSTFDYETFLMKHTHVKHAPSGELRVCCPKCSDEKYKLYVNDEKKVFKCFKCDFSNRDNDLFSLVALFENSDVYSVKLKLIHEYAEVAPTWDEILSAPVIQQEESVSEIQVKTLGSLPEEARPLDDDPQAGPFWDYVLSRGITKKEASQLKLHYVPYANVPIYDANSKYRGNIGGRVLIPIYGPGHKLVSWIARSIVATAKGPKYFNAPVTDLSKAFWPFVPPKTTRAVIVEGAFDSLAVRRYGHDAYSTFGKSISKVQLQVLKSWGVKEVILFWDKRDAIKEMKRYVETLKMHFDKVYVPAFKDWPKEKDAGDVLQDSELGKTMDRMLTDQLIDVITFEYAVWVSYGDM